VNWVDLIIIIVVSVFGLSGYYKGFIRQAADFVFLVIALVISIEFYVPFSEYLGAQFAVNANFSKIAAFFLLWVGVQFISNVAIHFLYPLVPKDIRKSLINKIMGAIPGLLWGMVFMFVGITLFIAFPIESKHKDSVLSSAIGSYVSSNSGQVEKYVSDIFGEAINESLTFLTVKPNSGETKDLGYTTTEVSVCEVDEGEMLALVNEERELEGLEPLIMRAELVDLAREHSRDMFARGYFAHVNPDGEDPFDRMKRWDIKFLVAGENLALAPNVELAHDGLMNSPGHRANILTEEFGKVGIGCIDGGAYGKMFSQEFTN
jgi:uncharacterized protein YkwD